MRHVQDLEAQVQSMLEERDCSFMDSARLQRAPHCPSFAVAGLNARYCAGYAGFRDMSGLNYARDGQGRHR